MPSTMKTILVIGGAVFVGGHACKALSRAGMETSASFETRSGFDPTGAS
jgi:hypothetical protein